MNFELARILQSIFGSERALIQDKTVQCTVLTPFPFGVGFQKPM